MIVSHLYRTPFLMTYCSNPHLLSSHLHLRFPSAPSLRIWTNKVLNTVLHLPVRTAYLKGQLHIAVNLQTQISFQFSRFSPEVGYWKQQFMVHGRATPHMVCGADISHMSVRASEKSIPGAVFATCCQTREADKCASSFQEP